MKQILQTLGTGEVAVRDVPAPALRPGGVLVVNRASVVSVGTDRMQLDFGRKSLLAKARERPQQVRQVLQSVARDGLRATRERVARKLDSQVALGYSCAGVVEAVGQGVADLAAGQRVACAGAGYASHAERVWVPANLVVPVPDGVSFEHAAFATMGAIALQGVRQAEPRLGDVVAVIGLGLLGQLTVQLLHAAGARVIAIDVDPERVALAAGFGARAVLRGDAVEQVVATETGGIGADAVLIAAATSSDDPIRLAGRICRDRGRVVLVGAVPMNVPRSPYYEKELELPLLPLLRPRPLRPRLRGRGPRLSRGLRALDRAPQPGRVPPPGGDRAGAPGPARHPHLLPRGGARRLRRARREKQPRATRSGNHLPRAGDAFARADPAPPVAPVPVPGARPGIGFIGAGSFAADMLLPLLRGLDVDLAGVATARGVTALQAGRQFGFRYLAESPDALLEDESIQAVFIATRHDQHARLAAAALRAGKAVFVEKPLALDEPSLADVVSAAAAGPPLLVGFNRRFAPATLFLRERLARLPGARVVHVRANAGALPPDHWTHDPAVGGGRIIGEACHFIDLAIHLVGSPVCDVTATGLGPADSAARLHDDVAISLAFEDGSLASVLYTARGNPGAGKERVEVFAAGVTMFIDDFRSAEIHGQRLERWKGKQDKGHAEQLRRFVAALKTGGPSPIPLRELEDSSRITLQADRLVRGWALADPGA